MFKDFKQVIRLPHSEDVKEEKEMMFNCGFCKDRWESELELQLHKTIHIKELNKLAANGSPVCIVCIEKFTSQSELICHVKMEHLLSSANAIKVEREIFVCDICSAIFFNNRMLTAHIKVHHYKKLLGPTDFVICPVCNKRMNGINSFQHMYCHKMSTITCCPICFTNCKNSCELKLHTSDHNLYIYCDICAENFVRLDLLKKHIEEFHSQKPTAECVDYEKYFIPINSNNNSYKLSIAKGLVLLNMIRVCVLCRGLCVDKKEMKKHIFNHKVGKVKKNAEKKLQVYFACICGEQFPHNIFLKQHLLKCTGRPVAQ